MRDRGVRAPQERLQSRIDPAEQLLFACAAAQAGGTVREAVDRALSEPGLDWAAAARMSLQHGVAPLVAKSLSGFREDPRIPSDVAACFARILAANGFRNRILFRETARLAQALEAANIPYLVLKGVGLALTVYPDPALRSFADVDLLVRPEDLEAADQAARGCGFRREDAGTSPVFHHSEHVAFCEEDILTGTLAPEFDTRVSAETIARLGHRVPLEIHIGLFRLPSGALRRVDMAPFWERAQAVPLPDGTLMRVPSPEAMLVHLAAHAAGDVFGKLVFPVDMALLLQHYEADLDWQRVVDLADRYAVRRDLCRLVEFVADYFGRETSVEPLPPSESRMIRMTQMTRMRTPLSVSSVKSVLSVIQTEKRESAVTPASIFAAMRMDGRALVWQRWKRSQNVWERLLSLGQILFPAPATMRRFYGVRSPLRIGLYYLLRPFHLAAHLARAGLSVRPVHDRR
ncbi:MAG TPA: nucleotidyltransferase family protein [Chthonomonadaceae bacterium]|nr:nucleotidyltransferase family protein [Chthonomonadaceae bacterium]